MADPKDKSGSTALATFGGAFSGVFLAELLRGKPPQGAADTEKLDYIIQLIEALGKAGVDMIKVLNDIKDLLAGQGGAFPSSILTPWVAKEEPVLIFEQAIRNAGVFFTSRRVDFRNGKRLAIRVENTHNQGIILQSFGNFTDTEQQATNIGAPVPCAANANVSIGFAFDDWQPYIGVQITVGVAPTDGILKIYAVMQE